MLWHMKELCVSLVQSVSVCWHRSSLALYYLATRKFRDGNWPRFWNLLWFWTTSIILATRPYGVKPLGNTPICWSWQSKNSKIWDCSWRWSLLAERAALGSPLLERMVIFFTKAWKLKITSQSSISFQKKAKLCNQKARLSSTHGHDLGVGALFLLHRQGVPKFFIKEEQSTSWIDSWFFESWGHCRFNQVILWPKIYSKWSTHKLQSGSFFQERAHGAIVGNTWVKSFERGYCVANVSRFIQERHYVID